MRNSSSAAVGVVVALAALILVYSKNYVERPSDALLALEEQINLLASTTDDEQAETLSEQLLESGSEALEGLIRKLGDPATRRPEALVLLISDIGDPAATEVLRQTLQEHPDALARRAAATALGELPDHEASPLLKHAMDADPSLQVRQAAVLALSDLGDDAYLADLIMLLEPTTMPELRESANGTLEVLADRDFELDPEAAAAWLRGQVGPSGRAPGSSIGGRGRSDGLPLILEGPCNVTVGRSGPRLTVRLTGETGIPMNLIFELEHGRLLVELLEQDGSLVAVCTDAPETGRALLRHPPIEVEQGPGGLGFWLPRIGQLTAADQPSSVKLVGSSGH